MFPTVLPLNALFRFSVRDQSCALGVCRMYTCYFVSYCIVEPNVILNETVQFLVRFI